MYSFGTPRHFNAEKGPYMSIGNDVQYIQLAHLDFRECWKSMLVCFHDTCYTLYPHKFQKQNIVMLTIQIQEKI